MAEGLILVAASGLAREVLATLEPGRVAGGLQLEGIVDDDPALHGTDLHGYPVLGGLSEVRRHPGARLLICAGHGSTRAALRQRLVSWGVTDARFARLIDPTVFVPASCAIGTGTIVLAGCVLTADVSLGRHVVLMPHVTLTHDDHIDDFATLCAGVVLGGGVVVGSKAYLGMASSVREHCRIGPEAVLGMGGVLLTDLPAGQIWAGVPARPLTSGVR
jgi:sugar O-acyltransferase (sialic acid O-acetyltransferase NeuD family)